MTQKLAQFTDIRVALVVGGLSLSVQASTLRTSPDIVVATPVSVRVSPPPPLPHARPAGLLARIGRLRKGPAD
jgi:hypothetical protein